MDTKVKATVYAKALRARLAELKAAREKALAAYKTGVVAWRAELTTWIVDNAKKRIAAVGADEIKRHRTGYNRRDAFAPGYFFVGAPQPPEYPDDKQIRDISALLRQLGITGVETVNVSTEDVKKYLENGADE